MYNVKNPVKFGPKMDIFTQKCGFPYIKSEKWNRTKLRKAQCERKRKRVKKEGKNQWIIKYDRDKCMLLWKSEHDSRLLIARNDVNSVRILLPSKLYEIFSQTFIIPQKLIFLQIFKYFVGTILFANFQIFHHKLNIILHIKYHKMLVWRISITQEIWNIRVKTRSR